MICGVYKIKNKITGWCYIGSSKNCKQRLGNHRRGLRKNTHCTPRLQRSWNKHGEENFEFRVIEITEYEQRVVREQWYLDNTVKKYNTADTATPGPHFPKTTWSEERKKKHSDLMKGNTFLRGKKASEETKKKLSIARKGKKVRLTASAKEKLSKQMSELAKRTNKDKPQNKKGYIQSEKAREKHRKVMKEMVWSKERIENHRKITAERNRKNSIKNNPEFWTPEKRAVRSEMQKKAVAARIAKREEYAHTES